MEFFPAFFDMTNAHVVVFGTGDDAIRKVRLLEKTPAQITIIGDAEMGAPAEFAGAHTIIAETEATSAMMSATIAIIASETFAARDRAIALARQFRVPANVVDNRGLSDFIVPSLIDRGRLVAAITTSGAAPVLGSQLRTQFERSLPPDIREITELARSIRAAVRIRFDAPSERRAFWRRFTELALSHDRDRAEIRSLQDLAHQAFDGIEIEPSTLGVLYITADLSTDDITLGTFRFMQTCDTVMTCGDISPDWLDLTRRDADRTAMAGSVPFGELMDAALAAASTGTVLLITSSDLETAELIQRIGATDTRVRVLT